MRTYKVDYVDFDGDATELKYVVDVRVTQTLDADVNKVEITLGNFGDRYVSDGEVTLLQEEILKVYANNGPIDRDNVDHLLGTYTIKDISLEPENETIEIVATDRTYDMLSRVYAVRDSVRTVDEHVKNVVRTINEDGDTTDPVEFEVASARSDDTSFPEVHYTSSFKKAIDVIKELSQPSYTGDDLPYRFYFDEDNVFHWFYPGSDTTDGELDYKDEDVINMSFDKKEAKAIAMVIYNAGEDLNGTERLNFIVDDDAEKIKNQMSYEPMKDVSENIRRGIQKEHDLDDIENDTILDETSITNDEFVDLLDAEAKSRANAIMDEVGRGLWTVDVDLRGQKVTVGKLLKISAYQSGFFKRELRVVKVIHEMNKRGWVTKITCEEDPSKRTV